MSHQGVLKRLGQFPSDLYLEGSDQHRGWFNTSLMIGIGVDDRAPYKAVVTNGWVLDAEGKAMHKSMGNVVSPLEIIDKDGADVLRLWVSSCNCFSDVRMSEEILERIRDAYKKIRYTFRFLLGNLFDFNPTDQYVPYEERLEIDRWVMRSLARLIERATSAYEDYEFYKVYHLIYSFCVIDLSSFYIDVLKDRLYTFAASSPERKSAQSSIYEVTRGLLGLLSPIMPHTAEEDGRICPGRRIQRASFLLSPIDRSTRILISTPDGISC